jgi:hypothetical protein
MGTTALAGSISALHHAAMSNERPNDRAEQFTSILPGEKEWSAKQPALFPGKLAKRCG